jgi:hypothetical protein
MVPREFILSTMKGLLVINEIVLGFPIHDNSNDSQFPISKLLLSMLQLKSCFYGS